MAATYSGHPGESTIDAVRSLLGDTGGDAGDFWLLTDEEITYFDGLVQPVFDSPIMTAAICADILAGRFSGEVSISADGVSISTDQLQNKYLQLGVTLRATYKTLGTPGGYPIAGGIDGFTVHDPSIRPLMFGIGRDDNYRAGSQSSDGRDYFDLYDSTPW